MSNSGPTAQVSASQVPQLKSINRNANNRRSWRIICHRTLWRLRLARAAEWNGWISVSAAVKCYGLPRTWPIIYCYWQLHLLSSDARESHQPSNGEQNNIHPDPQWHLTFPQNWVERLFVSGIWRHSVTNLYPHFGMTCCLTLGNLSLLSCIFFV